MKQVKLYTDWFGCLIDTLKQKDKRAYIQELKMYVHTLIKKRISTDQKKMYIQEFG